MDTLSNPEKGWTIFHFQVILFIVLILIIAYYHSTVSQLKNEIKKGCSNFSDPSLTYTRSLLMAKIKDELTEMIQDKISKEYDTIMEKTGKLREYKKQKIKKTVTENISDTIDAELESTFD